MKYPIPTSYGPVYNIQLCLMHAALVYNSSYILPFGAMIWCLFHQSCYSSSVLFMTTSYHWPVDTFYMFNRVEQFQVR